MRHILHKSMFLTAIAMLSGVSAFAIPAKRGVIRAEQPDGSQINIRLKGDEQTRRAYSSDGYLLTQDADGFYVIADCDENGNIVPTDIRQIDPGARSAQAVDRISQIKTARVADAMRARQASPSKAPAKGPGLFDTKFPSMGEHKSIAILVEFADKQFSIEDPNDYFYRMLNEEGFSDYEATGSARDFFIQNSNGLFLPHFDVYGPIRLDRDYSYYGKNNSYGEDANVYRLPIDACTALDEEIDFSQYDCNDDGEIDNVYIFYAGFGEADGGNANTIWPHSWDLDLATNTPYFFDGVKLNHYACSNELQFYQRVPDGIGAFVHEFGHVMGLPDLYSTSYTNAFTPGEWDVMDGGSYNNGSRTPPNYSSYERYALDWMEPELLEYTGVYQLVNLAESNHAFIVPTENPDEFYLFENRQQVGNDLYIPYHGMLVWHIEYVKRVFNNNIVNNNPDYQYVDLVEADGKPTSGTRRGDSFPGNTNVTSFTTKTKPALLSRAGEALGVELFDIAETDGIITFRVEGKTPEETAVDAITTPATILVDGNMISSPDAVATVYDFSGRRIALVGADRVELPAGMYIVNVNGQSYKIAIR